jgi:hypothetical protein
MCTLMAARSAPVAAKVDAEPDDFGKCDHCGTVGPLPGFVLLNIGGPQLNTCRTCTDDPAITGDVIRARFDEPCHVETSRLLAAVPPPRRAPTQADLNAADDRAVRELLARGPVTWDEMYEVTKGSVEALMSRMGLVYVGGCDVHGEAQYSMPSATATEAGK